MSSRRLPPDESPSQDERVRRIVADYRRALLRQELPNIDDVVGENSDLDSELLREALATALDGGQTDGGGSGGSADDLTQDWTAASGSTAPGTKSAKPAGDILSSNVGGYRILRELGRGGMGVVYEAKHTDSDRHLALKILSPDLPRTEQTVERFLNEASLAAALSHPRTTFVYEAGESDGHIYISMELMPGRTLRDVVQSEGPLPVSRAVDYMMDLLEGLAAAHKAGIVHRDVKPSNCFLDNHGRVKVGDFGLSKSLVAAKDLTQSGAFLGTPQFAAPEQFGRGEIDHRTDILAAAATLYFLLTGDAPFKGDAAAVIAQIVADDPPALSSINADITRSLGRIVSKALSKQPNQRYQDITEFRSALMPYSSGGSSMADVGRRVAAFFVDVILISIVSSIMGSVYFFSRYGFQGGADAFGEYFWVTSLIWLPYFAISEGVFSRSLGKALLQLRVVDEYGEPPGFLRAGLRALIVPGLSWMMIDVMQWQVNQRFTEGIEQRSLAGITDAQTAWTYVVFPQAFTMAKGLLALIVCSSMRARNGYRGLHEFASGTRVLRLFVEEPIFELRTVPHYASVATGNLPESIGPFRINGRVGVNGSTQILTARDNRLDRAVWIYLGEAVQPLPAERVHLARSTRQRWLSEGTLGDLKWQAFEAVDGAPLPDVSKYATIPWAMAGQIGLQAADELQASLIDGTLPETLAINQIWVDRVGGLKLTDFPLGTESHVEPQAVEQKPRTTEPSASSEQRALRLLRDVLETCADDDETPAEALSLVRDLQRTTSPSLQSIHKRMESVVARTYRLRWDDRLGILAISVCLEAMLLCPPALVVSALLRAYGAPVSWSIAAGGAVGLGVATAVGYLMRGGLAFWLARIEVQNRFRRPASGRRCAWRNVIAWFAIVMVHAIVGPVTIDVARGSEAVESVEFALMVGYQVVLLMTQLSGILVALLQPRRGLQDLLAGTSLVRRTT